MTKIQLATSFPLQPSLMNFCVTDGESVVVTRYISSRVDEAASLVCSTSFRCFLLLILTLSSGFRRVHRSASMLKEATIEWQKLTGGKILSWYGFYIFEIVGNSQCHWLSQIASEPLTFERGACYVERCLTSALTLCSADWMEIKTNHMVVITPKMNLLQIPIKDKFYVPPSDPAALTRATEFAQEKGFLVPQVRKKNLTSESSIEECLPKVMDLMTV